VSAVTEEARPVFAASDDDSRFYPYPPTGELLDRVTNIIGGTDAKPWIAKWHGSTSTAWCVDNLEAVARTKVLRGRKAAIDLGKDEAERIRDLKADAGTYVHDVQEALILWAASRDGEGSSISIPLLPEHLQGAWYSFSKDEGAPLADVVEWMVDGFINFVGAFKPRFRAAEMPVYNQPLGYAGTLDMIIELDGYAISVGTGPRGADEIVARPGAVLVVCVDTKTGKAMEGTWKEQVAAYRRAPECDPSRMGSLRPMPKTDCGAVLHLRPDYPGGHSLTLVSSGDDAAAWERFAKAASIYRERQQVKDKPGPAIRALRADGTMPGPRLCDLNGEGYGRALSPISRALGAETELADLARFTAADILAVKGVGPKLITAIRGMLADYRLTLKGEALAAEKAAALCPSTGSSTSSGATRRSGRSASGPPSRCPARTTASRCAWRRSASPRRRSTTPARSPRTTAGRSPRGRSARAAGRSSPTARPSTSGCRPASSRSTRTWSSGTGRSG
jgi:hypothetical protein